MTIVRWNKDWILILIRSSSSPCCVCWFCGYSSSSSSSSSFNRLYWYQPPSVFSKPLPGLVISSMLIPFPPNSSQARTLFPEDGLLMSLMPGYKGRYFTLCGSIRPFFGVNKRLCARRKKGLITVASIRSPVRGSQLVVGFAALMNT